jgi:hypothetical protein
MGDRTSRALAARVLVELNSQIGPLHNVFRTRPFQKRNRVDGRPVKLVTVVDELKALLDVGNAKRTNKINVYGSFTTGAWRSLSRGHDKRILTESKKLVSQYFGMVSATFDKDWHSKDSLIFTSKYLAAFCRLLVSFRARNYNMAKIGVCLDGTRNRIARYLQANRKLPGPRGELLWKNYASLATSTGTTLLPPARGSLEDIYNFLKKKAWLLGSP